MGTTDKPQNYSAVRRMVEKARPDADAARVAILAQRIVNGRRSGGDYTMTVTEAEREDR